VLHAIRDDEARVVRVIDARDRAACRPTRDAPRLFRVRCRAVLSCCPTARGTVVVDRHI